MPALANIAIADAAVAPVTHTFAPVTTDGSRAELANRAASIPAGFENLSLELKKPASATGAYRLIGKMSLPTVVTVNGIDTVVRQNVVNFDVNMSQQSTAQERKNAAKLLSNLFAHATVVAMVDTLEPIY